MRAIVEEVFFDFTVGREGFTPFLYCDRLNLVTTGVGNLVDAGPNHGGATEVERAALNNVVSAAAMAPAMRLPWRLRAPGWTSKNPLAGELVSPSEVSDAWTKVKRQNEVSPGFAQRGGFAYASLTSITLDMATVRKLFADTLRAFDSKLAAKYPGYSTWPADAQLAILSMSWAMGPNFNFPAFKLAVDALNFIAAAKESFFIGGGGTPTNRQGRNAENELMFTTAADVLKGGVDPDRLFFPSGIGGAGRRGLLTASNPLGTIVTVSGIVGALAAMGYGGYEYWKERHGKR